MVVVVILILSSATAEVTAQTKRNYIRIARLVVDSTQLDAYNAALKVHAEAAVRLEPGVLMLYAVQEKQRPSHFSVFEIYADENAYQFHITTPHFLRYKDTVKDMVKSLELIDVAPVALASKRPIAQKK
jgi:quinol monooxygenase YgiN